MVTEPAARLNRWVYFWEPMLGTPDTDPLDDEDEPAPALAGAPELPVPAPAEFEPEPATTVWGDDEWLETA
jgi:hypothetical protein